MKSWNKESLIRTPEVWEKIVYAAMIATVIFLSGVAYTIECAKLEYHEDQQVITLEIFGEVHCYQ